MSDDEDDWEVSPEGLSKLVAKYADAEFPLFLSELPRDPTEWNEDLQALQLLVNEEITEDDSHEPFDSVIKGIVRYKNIANDLYKEALAVSSDQRLEDAGKMYMKGIKAGEKELSQTTRTGPSPLTEVLTQLYSNLALVFLKQKKPRLALSAIQSSLLHDKSNCRAWFRAGRVYEELCLVGEAFRCYSKVVALSPDDEEAKQWAKRTGDEVKRLMRRKALVLNRQAIDTAKENESLITKLKQLKLKVRTVEKLESAQTGRKKFSEIAVKSCDLPMVPVEKLLCVKDGKLFCAVTVEFEDFHTADVYLDFDLEGGRIVDVLEVVFGPAQKLSPIFGNPYALAEGKIQVRLESHVLDWEDLADGLPHEVIKKCTENRSLTLPLLELTVNLSGDS